MPHVLLLLIVSLFALFHYAVVSRKQGVLTADGIFVLAQWIFVGGTLAILEPTQVDDTYSLVVALPFLLYVSVSVATFSIAESRTRSISRRGGRTEPTTALSPPESSFPKKFSIILYVLSVVITIGYFSAVGYNVFSLGLESLLSGSTTDTDFTSLRLQSYSGNRYFFPGYVNQFKNVLLPSLTMVFVFHLQKSRAGHRVAVSALLIAMAIFGLLGTGQRGAFILFIVVVIAFLYQANNYRFSARMSRVALIGAPFLLAATLFLGRSGTKIEASANSFDRMQILVSELFTRFVYTNQYSGVAAFHYTYERPTQNGAEWLSGLLGVLPGNSGSTLARDVFSTIYGSTRGTSPPSLWGSAHYNFGPVGLAVLAAGLGVGLQLMSFVMRQRPAVNTLELVGRAGVSTIIGTWVAGGPSFLLNSGAIAFAFLWWAGRRQGRTSESTRKTTSPTRAATRRSRLARASSVPHPRVAGPPGGQAPSGADSPETIAWPEKEHSTR